MANHTSPAVSPRPLFRGDSETSLEATIREFIWYAEEVLWYARHSEWLPVFLVSLGLVVALSLAGLKLQLQAPDHPQNLLVNLCRKGCRAALSP